MVDPETRRWRDENIKHSSFFSQSESSGTCRRGWAEKDKASDASRPTLCLFSRGKQYTIWILTENISQYLIGSSKRIFAHLNSHNNKRTITTQQQRQSFTKPNNAQKIKGVQISNTLVHTKIKVAVTANIHHTHNRYCHQVINEEDHRIHRVSPYPKWALFRTVNPQHIFLPLSSIHHQIHNIFFKSLTV